MVDIHSISPEGYEKIGGKAPTGGSSSEQDGLNFQAVLFQAQLQRLSVWTDSGLNSPQPLNLFNEYRIILEQARGNQSSLEQVGGQNSSTEPPAIRQGIVNPQLVAKNYELQSAPLTLDSQIPNTGETQSFSLPDLALLAGGVRGVPGALFQQLIQNESGFDANLIGAGSRMGLGQLTPTIAGDLGLRTGADRSEGSVWHPASNLDGSARHLRSLYDQFIASGVSVGEAWRFATGAYNAGIGNVIGAMELLEGNNRTQWDRVANELGRIMGARAEETVEYVNRLR